MGYSHPTIIDALVAAALPQLQGFEPQALANTAWALAVCGVLGAPAVAVLEAAARVGLSEMTVANRCQLHQLALCLADGAYVLDSAEGSLLQHLLAACHLAWLGHQDIITSRFQAQVHEACLQLGDSCQVLGMEHHTEDGMFSIDVALHLSSQPSSLTGSSERVLVAVEADGPSHYTLSLPHWRLGSTTLRNRFLEHRGWRVLAVPFFEFSGLRNDKARVAYMKDRCQAVLANMAGAGGGGIMAA